MGVATFPVSPFPTDSGAFASDAADEAIDLRRGDDGPAAPCCCGCTNAALIYEGTAAAAAAAADETAVDAEAPGARSLTDSLGAGAGGAAAAAAAGARPHSCAEVDVRVGEGAAEEAAASEAAMCRGER